MCSKGVWQLRELVLEEPHTFFGENALLHKTRTQGLMNADGASAEWSPLAAN